VADHVHSRATDTLNVPLPPEAANDAAEFVTVI
jgi:hypothetical protein